MDVQSATCAQPPMPAAEPSSPPRPPSLVRWFAVSAGLAVLLLGAAFGAAWLAFGSVRTAMAALRGEGMLDVPARVFLGDLFPEESRAITIRLANAGRRNIEIIGIQPTCSCVVPARERIALVAGKSYELRATITAPAEGTLRESIGIFYLEGETTRRRAIEFVGTVAALERWDAKEARE